MGAIYLIRHGQASFGSSDYDKLSSVGCEQAGVLGASLAARKVQPDVVVCGGMQRHRQTAEHCLRGMGREPSWDEDSGWNEYDHQGMLEAFDPRYAHKTELAAQLLKSGDPRRTFQEVFSQAAARWVAGEAEHDYEESFSEFCARVGAALARLHARLGKAQTGLVFTSGGGHQRSLPAAARSARPACDGPELCPGQRLDHQGDLRKLRVTSQHPERAWPFRGS